MDQFTITDKWGNLRDGVGGQSGFNWKDAAKLTDMKLLIDRLLAEEEPPTAPESVTTVPSTIDEDASTEDEQQSSADETE